MTNASKLLFIFLVLLAGLILYGVGRAAIIMLRGGRFIKWVSPVKTTDLLSWINFETDYRYAWRGRYRLQRCYFLRFLGFEFERFYFQEDE